MLTTDSQEPHWCGWIQHTDELWNTRCGERSSRNGKLTQNVKIEREEMKKILKEKRSGQEYTEG